VAIQSARAEQQPPKELPNQPQPPHRQLLQVPHQLRRIQVSDKQHLIFATLCHSLRARHLVLGIHRGIRGKLRSQCAEFTRG